MTTLILGAGLIGAAVARRLQRSDPTVIVASRRRRPMGLPWRSLDAGDDGAIRATLDDVRPDRVVLVHGPSDITWCEDHGERALAVHAGAARVVAARAQGARVLLVSSDNVFSGAVELPDEDVTPEPANAYGRAKLAAERELLAALPSAVVLRVSLVYGWHEVRPDGWTNFFDRCARALLAGEKVEAPSDQWTTPVLVDDTATVIHALLEADITGVVHLGGPDRVSRIVWARTIARLLGCDESLVVGVRRTRSRYASRPVSSCLTSRRLPLLEGGRLASLPRGILAGAQLLARTAPPRTGWSASLEG